MEQTFMTIHNLNPDANVLFASESVADILGYQPAEVQGKSAFDYFHPDEVPFARSVHSRGVLLDKAAVLCYARILSRDGRWVGCECCFTIVHDVLVACTSIYRRGAKSERRAIEAPQIRRIFSCSPRDPRYHMLEHLSPKFKMPPMEREPRAALILNRFTRNLTVMFATNAITSILGLRPDQVKNKSFYRCIQESCMAEATKCMESAKANDSIAYLRFCFQDPREDDEIELDDYRMDDADEPGIQILQDHKVPDDMSMDIDSDDGNDASIHIKREDDDKSVSFSNALFHQQAVSRASSRAASTPGRPSRVPSVELEAVVSCTSDGLVVVLRKARPPIPPAHPPLVPFDYGDGLFAAPWGQHPIQPHFPYESLYTFRPPLLPQYMPLRDNVKDAGGPPLDVLMGSIRDVAVFAWGLVGINPGMAAYGRGRPSGDARPADNNRGIHRRPSRDDAGGSSVRSNSRDDSDSDSSRVLGNSSSIWPPNATADKGKGPAIPSSAYGQYSYAAGHQVVPPAFQPPKTTQPESRNYPPTWSTPTASPLSCGIASSSRPPPFDYPASHEQYRHGREMNVQGTMAPSEPYYGLPMEPRPISYQQQMYGAPATRGPRLTPADSTQNHYYGWQ